MKVDGTGTPHLLLLPPPKLHFQEEETDPALPWLCPFALKGHLTTSWWYECIPHGKIILKKSKDDPSHEGKHDLQWSGNLFHCQHNICNIDLPFLSAVAHPSSNDGGMLFFAYLIETWWQNRDPVMSGLVSLHPCFHLHFFADFPALLMGFRKLIFSNGLDYATTATAMPNHISCWHFV